MAIGVQAKKFLNFYPLQITWSSFLLLILNKLLRKPFLVRNLYFTCSGTGLLYFLTRVTSQQSSRSEEKTPAREFVKLLKGNLANEYFCKKCTPTPQMISRCEQREESNNITKNASRSDILKLFVFLSADAKQIVVLRFSSLNNFVSSLFKIGQSTFFVTVTSPSKRFSWC